MWIRSAHLSTHFRALAAGVLALALLTPILRAAVPGKIVYVRPDTHELMLADADGANKQNLSDGSLIFPTSPVLSPDGSLIALIGFGPEGQSVYVMKAQSMDGTPIAMGGNQPLAVDTQTPTLEGGVAWSPTGRRLAYTTLISGVPRIRVLEAVDGGGTITPEDAINNPGRLATTLDASNDDNHPAWSPDGRFLAFERGASVWMLEIQNEAGDLTPESQATNPAVLMTDYDPQMPVYSRLPTWNDQGTAIAFLDELRDPNTFLLNATRISQLTVRDDHGMLTPESFDNSRFLLTQPEADPTVGKPSWSPDGSLIVFSETTGGQSNLATILAEPENAVTNPRVPITTTGEGGGESPSFGQPDQPFVGVQTIAFESANYVGNENDGSPIVVRVIRSGGSTGAVTVPFSILGGTATLDVDAIDPEDADYSITPDPVNTIDFADGETVKEIHITPIDDNPNLFSSLEGDEDIILSLDTPTGAELGTVDTATVTIADDESDDQLFTPPATELKVLVEGKAAKKGGAGQTWKFVARQQNGFTLEKLGVQLQYTATPDDDDSWTDLPGGKMSRSTETSLTWVATTTDIPAGAIFFRTVSSARRMRDGFGPALGAFTVIESAKLNLKVKVVTDSNPLSGSTAHPGENVTYTLRLKNTGTTIAEKVVLMAEIPKKTVFVDVDDAEKLPDRNGNLTKLNSKLFTKSKTLASWKIGTLVVGQEVVKTLTVKIDPAVELGRVITASHSNKARGFKERFNPTWNIDLRTNLRLELAQSPDKVNPGDVISYTLTAHNDGTADLFDATVTTTLPGGTAFESAASDDGSGNFIGSDIFNPTEGTNPALIAYKRLLTWTLGIVPAGATRVIEYKARVRYDVPKTFFANGVAVGSVISSTDYNLQGTQNSTAVSAYGGASPEVFAPIDQNGTPSASVQIGLTKAAADPLDGKTYAPRVAGSSSAPMALVFVGDEIEYTITFYNNGNAPARRSVLLDAFPAKTAFSGGVKVNGVTVTDFSKFTFYDSKSSVLSPGGEPVFSDANGNGKVDKGEYVDENHNGKFDGIGAIRSFAFDAGVIAPGDQRTITYRVRAQAKKNTYIVASGGRDGTLHLTSDSLHFAVHSYPETVPTRVVEMAGLQFDQKESRLDFNNLFPGQTFTATLRAINGGLEAKDTVVRVPIPPPFLPDGVTVADVTKGVATLNVGTVAADATLEITLHLKVPNTLDPKFIGTTTSGLHFLKEPFLRLNPSYSATYDRVQNAAPFGPVTRAVSAGGIVVKSDGSVVFEFRDGPSSAKIFVGEVYDTTVLRSGVFNVTVFFGNLGDTEAVGGEIGMQIPFGTSYLASSAGNCGALRFIQESGGDTTKATKAFTAIPKTVNGPRRKQDGTVDKVFFTLGTLPPHSAGMINVVLQVSPDFPDASIFNNSTYIKYQNATAKAPRPMTIQVRSGDALRDFWIGIGSLFNQLGSALTGAGLNAFQPLSDSLSQPHVSKIVNVVGADVLHLTNGVEVIPLGGSWMLVIGRGDQIEVATRNVIGSNDQHVLAVGPASNAIANNVLKVQPPAGGPKRFAGDLVTELGSNVTSIVAAGGGNIVAGGGLNLIGNDGASLIGHDGATLAAVAASLSNAPGIVAGGGGNLILTAGGNIVAAGGGNVTQAGAHLIGGDGASIVAAGGGNLLVHGRGLVIFGSDVVANDGAGIFPQIKKAQDKALLDHLDANALSDSSAVVLFDLTGDVPSNDGAGLKDLFRAGLVGQDGASLIGKGGAGIVAEHGSGFIPAPP